MSEAMAVGAAFASMYVIRSVLPPPDMQKPLLSTISLPDYEYVYTVLSRLIRERVDQSSRDALRHADRTARELATHVILPLSALTSHDVVVIRGDLDSPEMLLKWAEIPFSFVLTEKDLRHLVLNPHQTLIVGSTRGKFSRSFITMVRDFVAQGGTLVSTDRTLSALVEPAFPEYIGTQRRFGVLSALRDQPFEAGISFANYEDIDHRVTETLAHEPQNTLVWPLAPRPDVVSVKDAEKVITLLYSPDVKHKYKMPGVLYRFQHGAGVVYHSVAPLFATGFPFINKANPDPLVNILLYMQAKGASKEVIKQVEDEFYESRHQRKLFNIDGFRSALTRFEFLVRAILRQKQKSTGPVIPLESPPDQLENESSSAL